MTNPILKSEKSLRGLKNSFITRLNFLEQINALIKFNDSIHFDLLTVSEPKIRAHYFSFKFLSQYFRVSWELSKSKHSKQQSKSLKRNLREIMVRKKIQELSERRRKNQVRAMWKKQPKIRNLYLHPVPKKGEIWSRKVLMKTVLCRDFFFIKIVFI